ncbi:MAG: acetolactate synthase 3 large subunit [Pseudomonadota bacterium]
MEQLSGGDMLIRSLQEEGVNLIFGYPGGALLHVYDAIFRQDKIQHILVRHEQAAVHMADGFARASGKPGVVLATSGPGATNTITGIATAYMDSVPLVVITGQVASHLIGEDAFQETDMIGVSRPIVKHSFMVRHAKDIPLIIKKAFYIATSGRPGPVVVDIPKDMTNPTDKFDFEYPKSVSMRSYNPVVDGHPLQIKKAIDTIVAAKKLVIYVGGGAQHGQAHIHLKKFVERLNAPVAMTLMGLGAFPCTHPQALGMLGMHGTYEANFAMHNSDVILAVGARFDDRVTNNVKHFCPDATIIHIDVDPASISKIISAHIPIVGSVESVLKDLNSALDKKTIDRERFKTWWKQIESWRNRRCLDYPKGEGQIIKPQRAIESLYRATKGEAFVTSDVGQHQMFAALYYPYDKPRQWINSGGLGTMGYGLPAAMGVLAAAPGSVVACVTGEGSIQMNIQELSTCLQYNFPVKIINLNNHYLGMVKQWQDMQYGGRHSSSSYEDSLPDFVKLVESYHHVGIRVDRLDDLDAAMDECFRMTNRLVFMDIHVDPSEHVYPMQVRDGNMADMWLSKTERT